MLFLGTLTRSVSRKRVSSACSIWDFMIRFYQYWTDAQLPVPPSEYFDPQKVDIQVHFYRFSINIDLDEFKAVAEGMSSPLIH